MKKDPKIMLMGLNAATRTLIRPWMAEGGRPNLPRLVNVGMFSRLESILPPISRPARPGRTAQAVTADEESAKVEKRFQAPGYFE
jgi:predicted AlkP superfamily phosphohydrolase/phosphomutase